MSMTLVSRRVIPPSRKAPQKRQAPPPPRREESGDMVGERAKPFAAFAAPRRPPPPQTWWQKALKPAAISLGVLVSCGFAYILYKASPTPSSGNNTDFAAYSGATTSGGGAAARRAGRAGVYPGNEGAMAPIDLSARTGLTDESFLATAYVRRKVSLPNISGNCVVTGNGSRDVGECLRQQQE